MNKFLDNLSPIMAVGIAVGLAVVCVVMTVNAIDRAWLADYEQATGNVARLADSDDECRTDEHFDVRYGVCVKMRGFSVETSK